MLKRILFFIIMSLLLLPFADDRLHFLQLKSLRGDIKNPSDTVFSGKSWFSGRYQQVKEKYINESFGGRNFTIRLNNQVAYSLFDKAFANGVIIGKQNYLYEENYIRAYYGADFIGIDSITNRMQRLRTINDELKKRNKSIVLVFAAGKGSFYPEYFPDKYKRVNDSTNYQYHLQLAQQLQIPHIDFNGYFVKNRNKSKYPLYPRYGIHWSFYGASLVADSLVRYIEQLQGIDMPNLYWDNIEVSATRDLDYDIGNGLNLLWKMSAEPMAYPQWQFEADSGKVKPSVLVVSDSFYWIIYNAGITRLFGKAHFWFYNKEIFPDSFNGQLLTDKVDLAQEINQHDVIIIMATEATLPNLGWGFIEKTYNLLSGIPESKDAKQEFWKKVVDMRNHIKKDANWMKQIAEKAKRNNISTDSMLTNDAIWMLEH